MVKARVKSKRAKAAAPDKKQNLLERLAARAGGSITFKPAGEVVSPYSLRRPTGILSTDLGMRGGVPAGTVMQIYGPEGAGKDYIFNSMAAQVQQNYGSKSKIFVSSFGYAWDKTAMLMAGMSLPYTKDLADEGIDIDHPKYAKFLKRVGDLISIEFNPETFDPDDDFGPAEAVLSGVVACVESGEFQLGIINELPAAETQWHHEAALGEDSRVAALAKLLADFQRKYYHAMKIVPNNETTLVVTNQVRANIGVSYGKQTTEPCGFALKHLKAVDLHLEARARIKVEDKVVGKMVHWEIAKGKCGLSEGGSGEYAFLFYEGVDQLLDLLNVSAGLETLHKSGSWYSLPNGERIGQGVNQAKAYLTERPELVKELRIQAYALHGLSGIRFM